MTSSAINISFDSRQPAWSPIVEDYERPSVAEVLCSIGTALSATDIVRLYGQSLAGGSAGVAIFFAYLSAVDPNSMWAEDATMWLSHSSTGLSAALSNPSLYGGCTGVAWAVEHLGCDRLRDRTAEVDRMLLAEVNRSPWKGNYDLVTGLVGYGVYALERYGHPTGQALLKGVIERISENAVRVADGVTWWTPPELLTAQERVLYANGYFNLGLAHGVPGVIALLARACSLGIATPDGRHLLEEAVGWLLARRNPEKSDSFFPPLIPRDRCAKQRSASRVAWCYGDLGLSAALYYAALVLGERTWGEAALDIARRTAARPMNRTGVEDAGLCHGAAGNTHIFNRLYQATREPIFREAARYWLERTLAFYRPGTGVGGFKARWHTTTPGHAQWRHLPGLLQGAAGIGLALIAAASHIEPAWDRVLSVAIPPKLD